MKQDESPSRVSLAAIIAIALLARGLLCWPAVTQPERGVTHDSEMYLELGRHFTAAYLESLPDYHAASLLRTPGYPLFCF